MSPAGVILNFTRAIISIAHRSSRASIPPPRLRWIVVSSAARSFRLIVDLTKGKPWESRLIILFIISWDSRAEQSGAEQSGTARCIVTERAVITMWNDGLSRLSECTWLFRNQVRIHTRTRLYFLLLFFSFRFLLFRENLMYLPCYRYPPRKVAAK